MRKIVLSLLTAFAVILGLAVTSSSAYATDDNNDNNGSDSGIKVGADVGVKVDPNIKVGVSADTTATVDPTPPPCTVDHNPRVPGCQNSGPIFGGHHPGPVGWPWRDRFDSGRYIVLDGGPRLDLCSYATYGDLIGRNGVYRDRIGRWVAADRWATYRRGCGGNTVVVNNGDCTTVTTYYDNYRNSVVRWNDLVRRWHTPQLFNLHRGEFDNIYRDRVRWQRLFDDNRRTVTVNCAAPVTLQQVVVQAPPVQYTAPVVSPSADTEPVTSPAPSSSSKSRGSVPSGSVDSGGFDAAHLR